MLAGTGTYSKPFFRTSPTRHQTLWGDSWAISQCLSRSYSYRKMEPELEASSRAAWWITHWAFFWRFVLPLGVLSTPGGTAAAMGGGAVTTTIATLAALELNQPASQGPSATVQL